MGYHAAGLEYGSVEQFVAAMFTREHAHLDAFGRFIRRSRFRGQPLLHWLQQRNWARFAEGYNGPGYRQNQYDTKLRAAYEAALADEQR
jgi:hypothetical protein